MTRIDHAIAEIQRLQEWRSAKPITSIGESVQAMLKHAQRDHRRFLLCVEAWEAHVPAAVRAACTFTGFHAGTLSVAVTTSPLLFEIDRELRSGLLDRLREASAGRLQEVRLKIGRAGTPDERRAMSALEEVLS